MYNICFVHSVSEIGGAEKMSQVLMENLDKASIKSMLVCPQNGPFLTLAKNIGVTTKTTPIIQPSWKTPISSMYSFINWRKIFKKNKVNLIHTGDLFCSRALIQAASSLKIPVLCHIHFPISEELSSWLFKTLPKPSAFVYCSNDLLNDTGVLLKKYIPNSKHLVIHNGVDISHFSPKHITNKIIKIGIIANLQERKGHDDFLEMAKLVLDTNRQVQFEIIGGDILQEPREEFLKNKAKELNINKYITFHGQVHNVKELLLQLDIVICASHEEAFPVSILEAMSCAKPIVSTNVNGIPESIIHNDTGFLIPPKKPKEMCHYVNLLIDDSDLRIKMGLRGRNRIEKHFDLSKYTNKFSKTYNDLLIKNEAN